MARERGKRKEKITAYVSPGVKRKLEALLQKGEYSSESDLISTIIIEWLRDREKSIMSWGVNPAEYTRDQIKILLTTGPRSFNEIFKAMQKKGLILEKDFLKTQLRFLEQSGDIAKTDGTYEIKKRG